MDNPQPYQPLSHALHPPSTSSRSHYTTPIHHQYVPSQQQQSIHPHSTHKQPLQTSSRPSGHEEEEEEEEEDDDEDEGIVEDQLNQNDPDPHGSNSSSPRPSGSGDHQGSQPRTTQETLSPPTQKRGPGRPRGSKNRRPRVGSAKHEPQQQYTPQAGQPSTSVSAPTPSAGPPSHPNINPQNEQYYDFQWRVLTLCAEFYEAAEELIKKTPPLVVAQCYHMGPGVKVDPLTMLAEAKRICDTLLANPSQLVTSPPPPIYPVLPTTVYQPVQVPASQPTASISTTTATPTPAVSASAPQPNLITNPQSFIVPLVGQTPSYTQYPMYPPAQYPTPPYYQYTYPPYYSQQTVPGASTAAPTQSTSSASTGPTIIQSTSQPTTTIPNTPSGTMIGNSGSWSDEETERLKKLAEDSKSKSSSGEIEWDWVVQEWGPSRSRHQILLKATSLALKGSSTRGVKRRREQEGADTPASAPPPPPAMASLQSNSTNPSQTPSNAATPQQANAMPQVQQTQTQQAAPLQPPNVMRMPSTSSPAHTSSSTPAASPALQNQQRPPSSKGILPPLASGTKLPWPMPTVAVNTPSPVITPSLTNAHEQRTSYYRPRPNQQELSKTTPGPSMVPSQAPTHHYSMYPSNGLSVRPKENGK
ncbi:hypothetical protein CVT24_012394 [Panaeolus cyanescens]|uniref:Myb-like domain-containing protein n=1 Tax=Panaeolus cyanescens TaxID=181874 RepID=A0A409YJ89_9AGAR|nr:hypothetical protein CVT24_012394 [Panaeolus cyanescens]